MPSPGGAGGAAPSLQACKHATAGRLAGCGAQRSEFTVQLKSCRREESARAARGGEERQANSASRANTEDTSWCPSRPLSWHHGTFTDACRALQPAEGPSSTPARPAHGRTSQSSSGEAHDSPAGCVTTTIKCCVSSGAVESAQPTPGGSGGSGGGGKEWQMSPFFVFVSRFSAASSTVHNR